MNRVGTFLSWDEERLQKSWQTIRPPAFIRLAQESEISYLRDSDMPSFCTLLKHLGHLHEVVFVAVSFVSGAPRRLLLLALADTADTYSMVLDASSVHIY